MLCVVFTKLTYPHCVFFSSFLAYVTTAAIRKLMCLLFTASALCVLFTELANPHWHLQALLGNSLLQSRIQVTVVSQWESIVKGCSGGQPQFLAYYGLVHVFLMHMDALRKDGIVIR